MFFFILFELVSFPLVMLVGLLGINLSSVWSLFVFLVLMLFSSVVGLIVILTMSMACFSLIESVNSFVYKGFFLIFDCIFIVLMFVKVPVFPFVLWLPEMHVEANTEVSIILASVLLKLSSIGFVSFSVIMLNDIVLFTTVISILCFIGIMFSSLWIILYIDFKRVIAYSSIIHMNFSLFGMVINDYSGLFAFNINIMIHGLLSSFMFYFVGFTSECFGSSLISNMNFNIILFPIIAFSSFYMFASNVNVPMHINF